MSNVAEGKYSTILGGYNNKTTGSYSSIISGSNNTTPGHAAVVVGGGTVPKITSLWGSPAYDGNAATGNFSIVVGGMSNRAIGNHSAILAGGNNITYGQGSAVSGGGGIIVQLTQEFTYNPGNIAYGNFSLVSGGEYNRAGMVDGDKYIGDNAVVVGGEGNQAVAKGSIISGGKGNLVDNRWAQLSAIMGGVGNHVSGTYSVVVGGKYNVSAGDASVVVGGMVNWAFDHVTSILGGLFNIAGVPIINPVTLTYPFAPPDIDAGLGDRAGISILGGYHNRAYEKLATITGGVGNIIGKINSSEQYCMSCNYCSGYFEAQDYTPLDSPILFRDCNTCQTDCEYSYFIETTAATITGGHDNNLAGNVQNDLYYPWRAGTGFDRWYYEGCANQDCN